MKKTTDTERVCALCEMASPAPSDSDGNEIVFCIKRGPVLAGGCCRKFKYDLLKRDPKRQNEKPEIEKIEI